MRKRIFIAFALIVLVPTLLALVVITHLFSSYSRETTIEQTQQLIESSYRVVDTSLRNYERMTMQVYYNRELFESVVSIAQGESEVVPRNSPEISELLQSIVNADRFISSVYLVTDNAQFVEGMPLRGISDVVDQYDERIREAGGRVIWSRGFTMTSSFARPYPVVFAMRGLRHNSETIAYLLVAVRQSLLEEATSELPLWRQANFSIYESSGKLVYSRGSDTESDATEGYSPMERDLSRMRNSTGYFMRDASGESRFIVYEWSDIADWLFVADVSEDAVAQQIAAIARIMWFVPILLGCFLIIAIYLLSAGVTKPLAALDRAMRRIETGDLSVRLNEQGPPEVSRLSRTVNSMAGRITELLHEVHEQAEMKKQAELRALRLHLSPHFVYNTLNTIRWIAKMSGQRSIANVTGSLIDVLRHISKVGDGPVPLCEEIELLDSYVHIQRLRYDEFELRKDVPEELMQLRILPLIVQPIVENSIVHGLANRRAGGILSISARSTSNRLFVTVADNGIGISLDDDNAEVSTHEERHTGLDNVRDRIELNHGPEFGVTVCGAEQVGTEVTLELPRITEDR